MTDLQGELERRFPEVELWLREREDLIVLKKIIVPEGSRGEGVGSAVLDAITAYADRTGKTVSAQPSTDFGASSKARLVSFYEDFGFVRNAGRNKDFRISEGMYRRPQ